MNVSPKIIPACRICGEPLIRTSDEFYACSSKILGHRKLISSQMVEDAIWLLDRQTPTRRHKMTVEV